MRSLSSILLGILSLILISIQITNVAAAQEVDSTVVQELERLRGEFRNLDPNWIRAFACGTQVGLQAFEQNFCDNPRIFLTHPIGSLMAPLEHQIQQQVNIITQMLVPAGRPLNEDDQNFKEFLDSAMRVCRASGPDRHEALDQFWRGLSARVLSLRPGSIRGYHRGRRLTQAQAVFLAGNPVFPIDRYNERNSFLSPSESSFDFFAGVLIFPVVLISNEENQLINRFFALRDRAISIRYRLMSSQPALMGTAIIAEMYSPYHSGPFERFHDMDYDQIADRLLRNLLRGGPPGTRPLQVPADVEAAAREELRIRNETIRGSRKKNRVRAVALMNQRLHRGFDLVQFNTPQSIESA